MDFVQNSINLYVLWLILINFLCVRLSVIINKNIDMGNALGTLADHRADLFMGTALLSLIVYLVHEAKQKKKHREQMLKKVAKDSGIQMNEVYLKQNVDHLSIRETCGHPIYKIVMSGGPCAGKTSAIEHVRQHFGKKGFRVFAVPEVPTMIVLAGGMILMSKFNAQERMKFQSLLIRFQMYIEDYFTRLADMSNQPSIVLCDRGTMDPEAYITKDEFQSILDEEGWSKVVLRDRRYDRVCCLASAANGAEKFYTLENNVARSQGLQTARLLDKKTLEAWIGHPHLSIIPNLEGESFKQKLDRCIEAIEKTVGIEVPKTHYAKVLVTKPQYPKDLHVQFGIRFDVFLRNDDERYEEDKITKWGQDRSYVYQRKYRERRANVGDYSKQIRRHLTSSQYVILREKMDPQFDQVVFKRAKFAWKNSTFTVDNIRIDDQDAYILRFYCKKEETLAKVPEFFNVVKDVTKEKRYTTKYIALKNK